jgi:hypothetical protein
VPKSELANSPDRVSYRPSSIVSRDNFDPDCTLDFQR